MFFIGIDPGLDGAVACITSKGRVVDIANVPTFLVKSGKKNKRHYDVKGMVEILKGLSDPNSVAALENVHPMPGEGTVSAFSFGRGLGNWEGILAALDFPRTMVTPQKWKKLLMDGQGKEKDASCFVAGQLFPDAYEMLTGKGEKITKNQKHGRADAILIAEHLRRTWTANA